MESLWKKTVSLPSFERLNRDIKTDVLIIGGGMAGLLCAHFLAQDGVDYVLIEADRICSGVTGNTTAKITSQHGLIYHQLLSKFGPEKARMYLEANEAAIGQYRKLGIPCSFEEKDAFVYSVDRPERIEKELAALKKIGYGAEYADTLPLPFPVSGAVRFPHQAQFHPLQFLSGIVPGLRIYEHTAARAWDGEAILTDRGKITAGKIIVATHFPFLNKHGAYFLKLYQHRSYVLALRQAADVGGMYLDEHPGGLSFRNAGDVLLLGGGSHRTGKQGGNWESLSQFAKAHYPAAKEVCRWAAQDCMTLDGIPYIGRYSAGTRDLYVATGFNKWGMTSSMVAATVLRDLVLERENPYEALFSPSRGMLRPQLAVNAFEATLNLLTPAKPRCPHMGCALKWNPQEHSWDCPCHGSRFREDGALIDNPATGDLDLQ